MVTSNTYNNVANISERAMDNLFNNTSFSKRVNRDFDDTWNRGEGMAKQGNTYNVRIPPYMQYRSGAVASVNAYQDSFVPIVLLQGGADIRIQTAEKTLNVDAFYHNWIEPMVITTANQIDIQGLALLKNLNQFTGTVGTPPATIQPILNAKNIIEKQSSGTLSSSLTAALDGTQMANAVNGLTAYFNPTKEISENYKTGYLGNLAGIAETFTSANMPSYTTGNWTSSTPVYSSGASDAGAGSAGNTITTTGWASGASNLVAGDVFTISGVYAVNPVSKAVTNQLKCFTVTTPVSDTSGTILMTFSPAMYLTGPYQNVNVLPSSGSNAIQMYGGNDGIAAKNTLAATQLTNSVIFHRDCFVLGMSNLDKPGGNVECVRRKDPKFGLNMRLTEWYDGTNDSTLWRLDVLFGWNILRQGFGTRLIA